MILHTLLLLGIFAFGYSIATVLSKQKINLAEILGISFPIGSLLISLAWFVLNWHFGLTLNQTTAVITMILSWGTFVFFLRGSFRSHTRKLRSCLRIITSDTKLLVGHSILLLLILSTFLPNIIIPVYDWDSITLYDFRARIVSMEGSYRSSTITGSYFMGYPPFTSMGHLYAYLMDSSSPKLFYSFMYASFVLAFLGITKRHTNKLVAVIGTIIVVSTPSLFTHSYIAYTNLSFVIYFGFACLYLLSWIKTENVVDIGIAGGMLAGASWTRSAEPLHLVLMVVLGLVLITKRSWNLAFMSMLMLPVFLLRYWWDGVVLSTKSAEKISQTTPPSVANLVDIYIQRTPEVIMYVFNNVIMPNKFLFILGLVGAILSIMKRSKIGVWSAVLCLALLSAYFYGTLQFSMVFEKWADIGGSLVRMSMNFIPLLVFTASLGVHKYYFSNRTFSRRE